VARQPDSGTGVAVHGVSEPGGVAWFGCGLQARFPGRFAQHGPSAQVAVESAGEMAGGRVSNGPQRADKCSCPASRNLHAQLSIWWYAGTAPALRQALMNTTGGDSIYGIAAHTTLTARTGLPVRDIADPVLLEVRPARPADLPVSPGLSEPTALPPCIGRSRDGVLLGLLTEAGSSF
jgi:hypothetical protein